jgi:hypothetical protein
MVTRMPVRSFFDVVGPLLRSVLRLSIVCPSGETGNVWLWSSLYISRSVVSLGVARRALALLPLARLQPM